MQNKNTITTEKETNDSFGNPNKLDDLITSGTQSLAKTTMTRRSFLGWAAKAVLALAGASLIEVLPIDREELEAEAAASNCNAWYMCGIYTPRVCGCACGSNSCPCGLASGNNPWFSCCYNGSSFRWIAYYDCCCSGSCTCSCCSQSSCDCYHPPAQQYWCGGVSSFQLCCTRYAIQGPC